MSRRATIDRSHLADPFKETTEESNNNDNIISGLLKLLRIDAKYDNKKPKVLQNGSIDDTKVNDFHYGVSRQVTYTFIKFRARN